MPFVVLSGSASNGLFLNPLNVCFLHNNKPKGGIRTTEPSEGRGYSGQTCGPKHAVLCSEGNRIQSWL